MSQPSRSTALPEGHRERGTVSEHSKNHVHSSRRRKHNWARRSSVPSPIDDELIAIGKWYLADCIPTEGFDRRTLVHRYWGLALWNQSLQDSIIFKCLALLTLHKKRAMSAKSDKMLYLTYKNDTFTQLRGRIATACSTSAGSLAQAICLMSFVAVMEGQFEEAAKHIRAISTMNCMAELNETQWAFVVWNDLRYSMKTETSPSLPFQIPEDYLQQDSSAWGPPTREVHQAALANWRLARHLIPSTDTGLFDILCDIHRLASLVPDRTAAYGAVLARLYSIEYRVQSLAALAARSVQGTSTARLFVSALQLHLLTISSQWTPSTPECRQMLLDRARILAQNSTKGLDDNETAQHSIPTLWALFVFATESQDSYPVHYRIFVAGISRLAARIKTLTCCSDFLKLLRKWPWLEPRYAAYGTMIWSAVLVTRGRRWLSHVEIPPPVDSGMVMSAPQAWYSGFLLFYY